MSERDITTTSSYILTGENYFSESDLRLNSSATCNYRNCTAIYEWRFHSLHFYLLVPILRSQETMSRVNKKTGRGRGKLQRSNMILYRTRQKTNTAIRRRLFENCDGNSAIVCRYLWKRKISGFERATNVKREQGKRREWKGQHRYSCNYHHPLSLTQRVVHTRATM